MNDIEQLLCDVPLPFFAKAKQLLDPEEIGEENIAAAVSSSLEESGLLANLCPGASIGITAGSRGIHGIDRVLRQVVVQVRSHGAQPVIIPCMGSHGGNAQGQMEILAHLGITEQSMDAPIVSEGTLTAVGSGPDGEPVYVDSFLAGCDGIIVVNRVKAHTAFRAPVESGLLKMMAVGMGKQKGADTCHRRGFEDMYERVTQTARVILDNCRIVLGLGLIENAYGRLCEIVTLSAGEIPLREPELLMRAKQRIPRLFFEDLDVLVVCEMGKDISGSGMDTNVIGRYPTPYMQGDISIHSICVLDLTDNSFGSAHGVGFADFTTDRLYGKFDRNNTYINGLTNKVCAPAKLPLIMPDDRTAIRAAIRVCPNPAPEDIRAVIIKNTHNIETIYLSPALLRTAERDDRFKILALPRALTFNESGDMEYLWD